MELNAEQIKKALECCHTPLASDCNDCGYRGQSVENGEYIGCSNRLMADALSLIKELTEENERWKAICDMKECVIENAEAVITRTKADTVRKMQERFIAEIQQTPNANEHFIKAWTEKIDQIAKEMLEENK